MRSEAVNAPFLSLSFSFSVILWCCCKLYPKLQRENILASENTALHARVASSASSKRTTSRDDDLALVVIARRLSRHEEFSRFLDVEESRSKRGREIGNETSSSRRSLFFFFFGGDGNDGNDDDERREILESRH